MKIFKFILILLIINFVKIDSIFSLDAKLDAEQRSIDLNSKNLCTQYCSTHTDIELTKSKFDNEYFCRYCKNNLSENSDYYFPINNSSHDKKLTKRKSILKKAITIFALYLIWRNNLLGKSICYFYGK